MTAASAVVTGRCQHGVHLCRFESSSVILGRMAEAVDVLVTSGKNTGKVACRVMYRLAHHADTLYQGIVAQKQSPEWNTAQAVIKQKRQQVIFLHAMLPMVFIFGLLSHPLMIRIVT